MENSNRTLSQVLSQNAQSSQYEPGTGVQNTQSFNTFLTVYAINLSHRYPDISDPSLIDYSQVRKVADFSVACSIIALETWEELEVTQRRPSLRQTSRSA